ncbi:hypothetical protein [Marinicella sp. W31]|uniref:hypothetical protein n=1 Tax=Marinicella sp. W31 TaxID=3023713 RepID=UPI0037574C9A
MNTRKAPEKKPPKKQLRSIQHDLFSDFLAADPSEVSNTVYLWESVPKYFFNREQIKKLRTKDGLAQPYKWKYLYGNTEFTVRIQPALIEQEDGKSVAFFPGASEEFVEEALKKIFSDQNFGMHDPSNNESWVRFSLRMIYKELKDKGRTRSIPQIKHAIDVMSSSVITIYREGVEFWKGQILQDLVTVGRLDYLDKDKDSHHVARLPLFISKSINSLDYRQFNYNRLMSCDEQLSRWIYKKLIHRYIQANQINDYHFMYLDIEKNSGLLQQTRANDNRRKVISALNELKEKGVIKEFETEDKREGRKIVDVKYTIKPSTDFVKEQKAANKRLSVQKEKLENKNLKKIK